MGGRQEMGERERTTGRFAIRICDLRLLPSTGLNRDDATKGATNATTSRKFNHAESPAECNKVTTYFRHRHKKPIEL
ncbi:MAG: hypothetical protein C0424_05260 [Sphingobacteriaceae bacterium]|nr:hypothetical protein [Sphingobacteriaceae bacterium]